MQTKEKGLIGEHYFLFLCSKLNIRVLEPRGDIAPYDCVIEHNNNFFRIQIKTSTAHRNGVTKFNISKTEGYGKYGKYTKEDCDFFFLYDPEIDKYAFISIDNIPDKALKISIRFEEAKIKMPSIRYFEDYPLKLELFNMTLSYNG